MPRLDRLQAILTRLQSRRVVTARELADRFGVSIRSIYRDLRTLEEAGIPVGAEAGVGYFLPDNYHLPPVMFTPEEASALLIGGKLTQRLTDEPVGRAYDDALSKIRAILHQTDKEALETIENRIEVFHYPGREPKQFHLSEIRKALAESLVINITYQKPDKEESEARTIEPIGLCYYNGNWHLIAWCRLRKAYRDFRTDRITRIETGSEKFDPGNHPSLHDYFGQNLDEASLHGITLQFDTSYLANIREMKYAYGYAGQENQGEYTLMYFLNSDLHGFAKWLLYAGRHVKVVAPDTLKSELRKLINELDAAHSL